MNKVDKKNAGFTLVELIVIIAILAIMVGGVTIGISIMRKKNVEKAAKNINYKMTQLRSWNMSKDNTRDLTIKKASGEFNLDDDEVNEKILDDTTNIEYVLDDGSATSVNQSIAIKFQRNGTIKFVIDNDTTHPIDNVEKLKLSNGSKTVNITMVADTGKHFIE